jgi:hypothetical protein
MSGRTAFGGNYTDGEHSHQQGPWGLEDGASIDAAQPPVGSYQEPGLPLAEIAAPEAELAWNQDIRIGRRQAGFSAQWFRPVLISVMLSAVLALGLVGGFQFLAFAPASTAIQHKPDCSDYAVVSDATGCVAPKSDREANAPRIQKVAAPAAMTNGSGHEPSHSTTQRPTASTNTFTLATHQNPTSPGPSAVAIQHERSLPRPTPVPETKPGTIEGWTVREVVGETAVLEGPNGQWRATSGDTVPGLGHVDSIVRWGSRWIVATSKGLVSTP